MLITFKTKFHADILMLGEVGTKMLEMMGFGTTVPGAIDAQDITVALTNLKNALDRVPEQVEPSEEAEGEQEAISLNTRAIPLIDLLEAAVAEQEYVRWE